MPDYRRWRIPGGTYFFTVNLLDRRRALLTDEIDHLRAAFARVREAHPYHIDAIVVLPDHLHCIWTLPPEDDRSPCAGVRSNVRSSQCDSSRITVSLPSSVWKSIPFDE